MSRLLLIVVSLSFMGAPEAQARVRGIVGQPAPQLWAQSWRNLPKGQSSFDVKAQRGKVVYLYFFQSWCPGCHSRGFPTLQAVRAHFAGRDEVVFAAVQTVFEGFSTNTEARAWSTVAEFGLDIPVGHDPGPTGRRSATMGRYRSGGTPWIVIIDASGVVRFNGFHRRKEGAITLIQSLLPSAKPLMSLPRLSPQ